MLNAAALVAAIGNAVTFARGRDLAAWLGLVPRQITTGGRPRLVGISKRGNKYLRKLLVHGARAALPSLSTSITPIGAWLRDLLRRAHKNIVIVALGNKLARTVWAGSAPRRKIQHPAAAVAEAIPRLAVERVGPAETWQTKLWHLSPNKGA